MEINGRSASTVLEPAPRGGLDCMASSATAPLIRREPRPWVASRTVRSAYGESSPFESALKAWELALWRFALGFNVLRGVPVFGCSAAIVSLTTSLPDLTDRESERVARNDDLDTTAAASTFANCNGKANRSTVCWGPGIGRRLLRARRIACPKSAKVSCLRSVCPKRFL